MYERRKKNNETRRERENRSIVLLTRSFSKHNNRYETNCFRYKEFRRIVQVPDLCEDNRRYPFHLLSLLYSLIFGITEFFSFTKLSGLSRPDAGLDLQHCRHHVYPTNSRPMVNKSYSLPSLYLKPK